MPHQQSVTQQIYDAVNQAEEKAQKAGEQAAAMASNVQQTVVNARRNVQDTAKKAVDTAHDYVEDVRKKADPYVESAKAKYESAKAAAGNCRETAQHAVENAKDQVNAMREKVTMRAQPYVDNVQSFDITKTAASHVLTHVISILLYVVWRVLQLVPLAKSVVTTIQEKVRCIGVVNRCAAACEKVPVVGPRTVEVITIAVQNVRTDLNEQIAQHESNRKKQS